jgi:hypothetical protein
MSNILDIIDKRQLPKLVKYDQYLELINTEPPAKFVKQHPFAKNVKYLPIEVVEMFLTRIYQQWKVEVLREGQLLNSLYVAVRLHYKNPVSSEWEHQDGLGAVPAKTEKGARASDMAAILSDAVMTGLPAAESFAIKDAAEKIGKLFGSDLNRKVETAFIPVYGTDEVKDHMQTKKEALRRRLNANN